MPAVNITYQLTSRLTSDSQVFDWKTQTYLTPLKTSYSNTVGSALYEKRETRNTPGFLSPGRGLLSPNPFLYEKRHMQKGLGNTLRYYFAGDRQSTNYTESGYGQGYIGNLDKWINTSTSVAPTLPPNVSVSQLDRLARTKVLLDIKDMKVNLAQVIAEREQTIKLFVDAVTRIAGALGDLKRGNLFGAAKHLAIPTQTRRQRGRIMRKMPKKRSGAFEPSQALADNWLALQYGWRPLLGDVYGAAESLAKALNRPVIGRASGRAKRETKNLVLEDVAVATPGKTIFDYVTNAWRYTLPSGVRRYQIGVSGRSEVSYHVAFYAPNQYQWATALGITNPLYLAWELLPFSFVADWFVNIGDVLSTLDATTGLAFSSGSVTTFHTYEWYNRGSRSGLSGSDYYMYDTGEQTYRWVYCQRATLTGFPEAAPPIFKDNPASKEHIANALALLFSNLK